MAEFVPYDDKKHRAQFLELNVDYLEWGRIEYLRYGIEFFRDRNAVREYVENALPKFVEAKPPQSILYILEVDGKAVGMGALMKLDEGVAELKRMYIRPEYRGYGYGRKMLDKLTETARDFGYFTLRLDTAEYMAAARHLYESQGFSVTGPYLGVEFTSVSSAQLYMEKKL
jgi:ribosomal protein S18 acetylase RimI-like enzyme